MKLFFYIDRLKRIENKKKMFEIQLPLVNI